MVNFGKQLAALIYEPWREYYLNYWKLKRILEGESTSDPEEQIISTSDHSHEDYDREEDFVTVLNEEIETCVLFFLQQEGKLASKLALLRGDESLCAQDVRAILLRYERAQQEQTSSSLSTSPTTAAELALSASSDGSLSSSSNENIHRNMEQQQEETTVLRYRIRELMDAYRSIGQDLLQLVWFVELCVTGTRKILKKHDKLYKDNPLLDRYLSENLASTHCHQDSHLKQLLQDEGVGALVTTLQKSLAHLHALESSLLIPKEGKSQQASSIATRKGLSAPDLLSTWGDSFFSSSGNATALQAPTQTARRTNATYTSDSNLLDWQQLGADATPVVGEPILLRIEAARRRLHESSRLVTLLAAQAMLLIDERQTSDEDYLLLEKQQHDTDDLAFLRSQQQQQHSTISNFLNLISTFIYMTNYYIAAPTSGAYAAKLGGDESLSGLIIGMTPIAALVSTVLYSFWTSTTYKAPLLFASTSSLLGNVLYALGLPYKSLTMVLTGRLLIGFGSCRSINRRYLADSYSREERTAASAAFVTAGSLGMAAGPALAAMLDLFPWSGTNWSVENAPGWLMFAVWGIYLVAVVMYFCDPPKTTTSAATTNSSTAQSFAASPTKTANGERVSELTALVSSNAAESNGENYGDGDKEDPRSSPPLWKNVPVIATLWFCFALKMTLECSLSSTATLTGYYFDWGASQTGMYLAILGLLMFPANLVVAYFCKRQYEDRHLILGTLMIMLVGVLGIINYTSDYYSIWQYISCSVIIFVGTNALEGPNMSLLSKAIPRNWARGILNVGLLATEAGTFGRSVGDVLITWCGKSEGIDGLLNRIFGSLSAVILLTVVAAYKSFRYLEPHDMDD